MKWHRWLSSALGLFVSVVAFGGDVSKVEWAGPGAANYTIKFPTDKNASPVYPLKYAGAAHLKVQVLFSNFTAGDLAGRKLRIHNWGNHREKFYPSTAFTQLGPLPNNITAFEVDLGTQDEVLTALGAKVNASVIRAEVEKGGSTEKESLDLHLMQQTAVVLLPGVMATELTVGGSKCWPAPTTSTSTMITKLKSDANGVPEQAASNLKVIAGPIGEGPYFITKWTGWLNDGLPVLKKGSDVVLYNYLQEYPYDWRYKAETLITKLMGADQKDITSLVARPNYSYDNTPSLKTIIRVLKTQLPFMGDKVAVAGHSTGGVILNGLIRTAGSDALISHAFPIATPFYGAPKTYYAFLKGTMKLGAFVEWLVLGETEMRTMAPNLAVLYYLSPTPNYPNRTARFVTAGGDVDYYRDSTKNANNTAFFTYFNFVPAMATNADNGKATPMVMKAVTRQRANGDAFLTEQSQSWNRELEKSADAFYATWSVQAPRIPLAKIKVFYSNFKEKEKPATLGPIQYDDRPSQSNRLTFTNIDGDGTVPMESLKGPWGDTNLVRVTANADHVGIADQAAVWEGIRAAIAF